jgi:hypothetical protein
MDERRKFKRFPVHEGTLAVFRPSPSRLCQIENISMGGMMVRYIEVEKSDHDFSDLTLLKSGENSVIGDLPFSIILDEEIDRPLPFTTLPLRRSHIKFGTMTEEQQKELEEFINSYSR